MAEQAKSGPVTPDPAPGAARDPAPDPAPDPASDAGVDEVTHAVLAASRLLVDISVRCLASVGEPVTLPQLRLLVVLAAHGDAKLVEVAERLGVNPSTAMRMLDRLIAAGLADRQSNPDDRRRTRLRLTPAGHALVERVTAARHREIAAIVARMAPAQRVALVGALAAFTEAGDEPPAEPYPYPYPPDWPSNAK
ncbi:MarR family winged helix-turn-helix transcriptional regulator [Streptomyces paludis]|uniref:MarR family transcriptional regulator n=1 Tax=Streptomyces paludis TaxID=2282738 RepID=A0A345HLC9_9ACTN|nr:MarR family transcriptional regulator [Streptomyces paludis]AXG77503.1 MarR family transcriptional regulator [Streptomyces paludis]